MSSEANKPKKSKKTAVPAQVSAQDTSNWDDKAFTAPEVKTGRIREFIGHDMKRDNSERGLTIRAPKDYKLENERKKNDSKD